VVAYIFGFLALKSLLRRNHSARAGVIENTAGFHDGADVAKRFEFIFLAAVHE
jgi:hypothetical protein